MIDQTHLIHVFPNGFTLLAEPMAWLESSAMSLVVPAGYVRDPQGLEGLGNLVCDMVQRGAGDRDSRQFLGDLERLGVDYAASVSPELISLNAATLSESLPTALSIFADVVRRPQLPEDQFEDALQVCIQDLLSLQDDLVRQMLLKLRRLHYPAPYGRSKHGTEESLGRATLADVRRQIETCFTPRSAVLAVAGKLDWDRLREQVESLFGDWSGEPLPLPSTTPSERGYSHIPYESAQTHIGLACDAPPITSPDFYRAMSGVSVLGDGMSSRLFTRVREERGLCYSVDASYDAVSGRMAGVQCYAGTTTERAQETFDTMLRELQGLVAGIEDSELRRMKARCKSELIMQQESSRARAGSLASQWYHLGRVRSLREVSGIIDGLTCESVNEYLASHPLGPFTCATLGAERLEIPVEIL